MTFPQWSSIVSQWYLDKAEHKKKTIPLLRVSVSRVACAPAPSPCPHSSLTHRFLGSLNSTPGILPAFSARLTTLLRVSVSRVACAPAPSPSPHSSLTHAHRFLGSRNSTPGNLSACSARLLCILCVPDDRDSACVPSPSLSPRSPSSRSSLTHTNRFLGSRNSTSARLLSALTSTGSMYSKSMDDAQPSVWGALTSSRFSSLSFITPTPSHFLSLALAFSVIIGVKHQNVFTSSRTLEHRLSCCTHTQVHNVFQRA
jgi:hypothetical protein